MVYENLLIVITDYLDSHQAYTKIHGNSDYFYDLVHLMETFELEGREYIELNKLLKLMHLVQTGGEANISIGNGEVMVNDMVELRKRNKLRDGYIVEFREQKILIKA